MKGSEQYFNLRKREEGEGERYFALYEVAGNIGTGYFGRDLDEVSSQMSSVVSDKDLAGKPIVLASIQDREDRLQRLGTLPLDDLKLLALVMNDKNPVFVVER